MFIQSEKEFVSLLSSFSSGKRGIGGGLRYASKTASKMEVFTSRAFIATLLVSRKRFILALMAKVLVISISRRHGSSGMS